MNNTSAYGNVLLKPAIPAPAASVPKRDSQDEYASADFQQTLKDLRANARAQDEKIARSAANKSAANKSAATVDARKHATEIAASRKSADESVRTDKSRRNNEATASDKQNNQTRAESDAKNSKADYQDNEYQRAHDEGNHSENKSSSNKSSKKADDVIEDTSSTAVNVIAEIRQTPIAQSVSMMTPESIMAEAALDASALTANSTALAAEGISTGSTALIGNTGTDEESLRVDAELQKNIAQQVVADTSVPQASATASPDDARLQSLAVMGIATPMASESATLPAGLTVDDIDALASLAADSLKSEKSSAKVVAANADAEMASAQAQTPDSKASFEKMLQTIARSDSVKADDSALLPNSAQSNTSNSSSAGGMDSLFRLSDTQTPAARSFVVQTAVPVPVGQPQWSQAVGERVLWLAAQNVTAAEIHLHPKDLGPIQVNVSVNQEQASVSFTSHHAVVREVLDQSLNRLRDMFSEQGLNLVNVDVSDKSFSRQQGDGKDQKDQASANGALGEEEAPLAVSAIVHQQRLVDHYA